MIIRLLRASFARADRPAFVRFLRGTVVPGSASTPGLVSFYAGLRDGSEQTHVALVGVWDELDELASAVGDFEHPRWVDQLGLAITVESTNLYELAGRSYPGVGEIRGEVLQIFTASIEPAGEAALHEGLRARQEALSGEDALLALHVGRRLAQSGTDVIAVAVWRDQDAVARHARPDFEALPSDITAAWLLDARLDTYEALESEQETSASALA